MYKYNKLPPSSHFNWCSQAGSKQISRQVWMHWKCLIYLTCTQLNAIFKFSFFTCKQWVLGSIMLKIKVTNILIGTMCIEYSLPYNTNEKTCL